MTTIEGFLDHITYHNTETHYTVARMKTGGGGKPVTIVGCMTGAVAGQAIRVSGKWTTHFRYGQQFSFDTVEVTRPATVDGIRQYLRSGIVRGIGPATADKIIARFGEDTFDILENAPERLAEIDGIGSATAAAIGEQWLSHRVVTDIMNFLQQHGIKSAYAAKIFRLYDADAIDILTTTPYRLAEDIPGIGFTIADIIARHLDMQPDAARRAYACIQHLLDSAAAEGHVYIEWDPLVERIEKTFEIGSGIIESALLKLEKDKAVVIDRNPASDTACVYLTGLHRAETAVAARVAALLSVPVRPLPDTAESLVLDIENRLALHLSDEQRHALESILSVRAAVVTGGPGTGKTTLIKAIALVFHKLGLRVCLAAPTGRAARRLSEITGMPAHTIHKLLGYNFDDQTFEKSPADPIDADVVITDEASMVDTLLMSHLIGATPVTSRLILVGDVFQLPPVGPGNILSDIIRSETVAVFRLNRIFRQAEESTIIVCAHRILTGDAPDLTPLSGDADPTSEFYFIEEQTPEKVAATIVSLCTSGLPETFALNPLKDIQVLSPMHKGVAGTIHLNQQLQKALNSSPIHLAGIHHTFKAGDRVMHLKNNYQKDVFNGDIGTISGIDRIAQTITVDFDGREVPYGLEEIDDLTLGYAISVHKSQGSEYPAVVLPVITQHYIMLQRNLLYTAITRARRLVVLVGSRKALGIALKNDTPQQRLTALADRLRVCCGKDNA